MMVGFYTTFREYLRRRHPHCFALLERLEAAATRPTHDLETLLSDLNILAGLGPALALLGGDAAAHEKEVGLARELRGYLDAFIVDTCERFNRTAAVSELQPLLAVREFGPLWIFTTNYDRVVEHACDQSGIDWTDGFQHPLGHAVADWSGEFDTDVRIVKLHGSVNWYVDEPGGSLHRLDRGYSLPAYDFQLVRGDQRFRPLMIIPTLEKEALGTPYIELSVRFTDALREARLLIIVGNSLRDRHVRDYIHARIGTIYVLLVGPSATRVAPLLGLGQRVHPIDAGFQEFLAVAGARLMELARSLSALPPSHADNGIAIAEFAESISRSTLDETAVRQDSDLYRLWILTRAPSVADRAKAVRQLALHPHPAVIRRLEQLLREDADQHVRVACVNSLLQVAAEAALPALCDALLHELSAPVQLELALALLSFRDLARAELGQALSRPDLASVARSVINQALPDQTSSN
jgi:hypothetical protein